jgi:uroporphyrinogen-III synthase
MSCLPVVWTRDEAPDSPFLAALAGAQVPVLRWPAVALTPCVVDPAAWADADLAVFVSPMAVRATPSIPAGARVVAQGPGTAAAARARGWEVCAVADPPTRAGLLLALGALAPFGRAHLMRGDLGAHLPGLTSHVVYTNAPPPDLVRPPQPLRAVVYASPSAARRMLDANPWLADVPTLVFGPTTAAAVASLPAVRVLEQPTPEALVQGLAQMNPLEPA